MKMRPKQKNVSKGALEETGYENLPHPAQRAYVRYRRSADRVKPDQVLLDMLGFGIVWSEIEYLTKGELDVLSKLLAKQDTELVRINLVSKLQSKRVLERKVAALGLAQPLLWKKTENYKFVSSFVKGISASRTLTDLQLHGIRLTVESSKVLSEGISEAKSLRSFSIRKSRCGDIIFKWIAKGVASNCAIREVDFSSCMLSDNVRGAVCDVIRNHAEHRNDERWTQSLRDMKPGLNEVDSQIALQGVIALDFSKNVFGDDFAASLAIVLASDIWVGAINLQDNRIREKGILKLCEVLKQSNNSIAILDLKSNAFSDPRPEQILNEILIMRGPERNCGLFSLPYEPDKESPASIIAVALSSWNSTHQISEPTAVIVSSLVNSAPQRMSMEAIHDMVKILRRRSERSLPRVAIKQKSKEFIADLSVASGRKFEANANVDVSLQSSDTRIEVDVAENDEDALDSLENSLVQLKECIDQFDKNSPRTPPSRIQASQENQLFQDSQEVLERLQGLWERTKHFDD